MFFRRCLLKFDNFELILIYFKILTETSRKSRPVRCLVSLQDLGMNRNCKDNSPCSPRNFHEPIKSGLRESFFIMKMELSS